MHYSFNLGDGHFVILGGTSTGVVLHNNDLNVIAKSGLYMSTVSHLLYLYDPGSLTFSELNSFQSKHFNKYRLGSKL